MTTVKNLMALPWKIQVNLDIDGRGPYFIASLVAYPGIDGYGETEVEARADLYLAMEDLFEAVIQSGEEIPLPAQWSGYMAQAIAPVFDHGVQPARLGEQIATVNTHQEIDPALRPQVEQELQYT